MSLTEHLAELRMRIIRSGLAIMIGGIVVLALYDHVLSWMLQPYQDLCERKPAAFCGRSLDPQTGKVVLFNLDPIEGLTTRLKVSFYGGLILAMPVVLWEVWRFIVPALHKTERRYAMGFVLSSLVLILPGTFGLKGPHPTIQKAVVMIAAMLPLVAIGFEIVRTPRVIKGILWCLGYR